MEERKLIELPAGYPILLAELRWFEEERGCEVVELRAGAAEFLDVCGLVGGGQAQGGQPQGLPVQVRVDQEVRAGHVVLVGGTHEGRPCNSCSDDSEMVGEWAGNGLIKGY